MKIWLWKINQSEKQILSEVFNEYGYSVEESKSLKNK